MTTETTPTTTTNWGRWGADDERGTLNLITPDAVLAGARTCRTGKVYSLSLPIQQSGVPIFDYRGAPRRYTLTSSTDNEMYAGYGAAPGVGANEDVLVIPSHCTTHMDALSHVFVDDQIYNGHPNGFSSLAGAPKCGIEATGSFAGRAVLLDLPAHQGVDWLEPGTTITSADLEACRAHQGVEMATGDILLVRTGWLDLFATIEKPEDVPFSQAGLGYDALDFVRDHAVAVVGADNAAIECIPFDRDVFLGVHIELLVRLGVTLLEHLVLTEMARDRCYQSLLCVGALPVTGATGSPINPIAIG
jgi:kynurenine formamidase